MYGRRNDNYSFADEIRTVLETLLIVFIVLKANNLVEWSWWAVLTPLWISLGSVIIGILGIIMLKLIDKWG
jgi:membrane protein YdbS with pleckstrin-like domain